MEHSPIISLLKKHGLKDTQPRRLVIRALESLKKPASPQDIQEWVSGNGDSVNTVTVYRVLEALEGLDLVHRHACDGKISLCSMPENAGHHGFLHCHDCGDVKEFVDHALCNAENAVAKRAGFTPSEHVSEILGTCSDCSH